MCEPGPQRTVLKNNIGLLAGAIRLASGLSFTIVYYVAHYVWPYHETVRMSVCLYVTCHISKTEPDRAIVTMDHYIEIGCN